MDSTSRCQEGTSHLRCTRCKDAVEISSFLAIIVISCVVWTYHWGAASYSDKTEAIIHCVSALFAAIIVVNCILRRNLNCPAKCRKEGWMSHIFGKPGVPVCTAHHLARACRQDLMPTDPQTLDDYGFSKFDDPRDLFMLLRLYQRLFLLHESKSTECTLDKRLQDGTLVRHIKQTFEQLPPDHRGAYHPWFLENQWVIGGLSLLTKDTTKAQVDSMDRELWAFLGPTRKAQSLSWLKEHQVCANLYRLLLSNSYPGPNMMPELYIGFGYCVAREMFTKMVITKLYTSLIRCCSFEEFCDAFVSSSMIALMRSKSIITNRNELPRHFEDIMSSRVTCESVWCLKQYLYGGDMTKLVPSVLFDYGFANCDLPADREALAAVYKTAFEHRDFDEMQLHAHCIRGQMLEYVGRFQKLTKKKKANFRRLMRNPYPLPNFVRLWLFVVPTSRPSR